jgi:hypothetical protein
VHLEVAAGNDGLGAAQRGDASMIEPVGSTGEAGATEGRVRPESAIQSATPKLVINVDRSAKGDRELASAPLPGLTLSFKVPSLPDSSVLMRVPAGDTADALRKVPAPAGKDLSKGSSERSSAGPRPVACEPVVSVLTAVAKQLEAGRCVT